MCLNRPKPSTRVWYGMMSVPTFLHTLTHTTVVIATIITLTLGLSNHFLTSARMQVNHEKFMGTSKSSLCSHQVGSSCTQKWSNQTNQEVQIGHPSWWLQSKDDHMKSERKHIHVILKRTYNTFYANSQV